MRSTLRFIWWYIRFFGFNLALVLSKFIGGLMGLLWFACLFPRAVWAFRKNFK